ncbi:hypothetical protein, partial [Pyramidobacter porci]
MSVVQPFCRSFFRRDKTRAAVRSFLYHTATLHVHSALSASEYCRLPKISFRGNALAASLPAVDYLGNFTDHAVLEAQRVLSGPAAHRILAGQSYAEELSEHAVACVPATHSPSSAIPS